MRHSINIRRVSIMIDNNIPECYTRPMQNTSTIRAKLFRLLESRNMDTDPSPDINHEMPPCSIIRIGLGSLIRFKDEPHRPFIIIATIDEDRDPLTPSIFVLSDGRDYRWISLSTGVPDNIALWDASALDSIPTPGDTFSLGGIEYDLSSKGTTRIWPNRTPEHFSEDHFTIDHPLNYQCYSSNGRTELLAVECEGFERLFQGQYGLVRRGEEVSRHKINFYVKVEGGVT